MFSSRYGDTNANFANILNTKEVIHIDNGQKEIYKGALTVEGGAVIKKGLKIGYQEGMVSGLLIYDNENFYGYSDKYGLILLSKHNDYIELEIEKSFFEKNDGQRLAPIQTSNGKNISSFDNNDSFRIIPLKLDIDIKDLAKFYMTIPGLYTTKNFALNIEFELSINSECLISDIVIVIINESNKDVNYKFNNRNCFYSNGNNNSFVINRNSVNKFQIEIVDKKFYLISIHSFSSSS